MGQFLSFVPTFGETLSAMANVGGQVAGSIDKMRMDNMVKTISRLGTIGDLERTSEIVARKLAKRYCNQLSQLRTKEEEAVALDQGKVIGTLSERLKASHTDWVNRNKEKVFREELLASWRVCGGRDV